MQAQAIDQINKVAVIGAGTMGIGICEVAAVHEQDVLLFDVNQTAAEKAIENMSARMDKRVARGKITAEFKAEVMGRISVASELADLAESDLVVEAIIENLKIKQDLFQQLEAVCSIECLLASNTSSISITAIAAGMKTPERLFGLHFFNPAPVMKLVEVISGLLTDKTHLQTGKALCEFWGKIPVIASSSPGFIVNRVARSFYGEPLKMFQEQLASVEVMDAVMTQAAGFRMGPFTLMDLIGIDINYSVSQTVYQAMYNDPRFRPSLIQSEMVNAGTLGRKSGRGFYDYAEDAESTAVMFEPKEQAPDVLVLPEELGVLSTLFVDVGKLNSELLSGDVLQVDSCEIQVTEGMQASQVAEYNQASSDAKDGKGMSVALIDLSFDYAKATVINLSFSDNCPEVTKRKVIGLFQALGKDVLVTDDQPGMIAMRTIAMLINEAADAVFNGVCSAEDVDLAMRYGVNYPKGLLAFAEIMGWQFIDNALTYLQMWFGDDRYRVSPYIQNKAQQERREVL
ncbi:3-hydroxyacyl-CoA dehydrogenase [Marinicella rhabdoformis]|uniref:3-hydroxyacyl-CoA dehydrogenase n=1 Tax=Marinicella rhabdoformis TaxID=2580566 RepID=UPI0012AEDAF6|nr:3-hydroxyacyl-CoA dehydrogenase [Marinicella rhabdoformis]